jgi:hypothetical protein
MGYPPWGELVRHLAQEFAPAVVLSGDYLRDVDRIADVAAAAGGLDEYYKYLDRAFCVDGAGSTDLRFHRRLVSLGFCGLITTNFDPVLEEACVAEYSDSGVIHRCEPVDLRDDRPYLVFEFLRGLTASSRHRRVLHLHGFHNSPRKLILGARDYAAAYGHDQSTPDVALRTLPRKIIWTLLATRPLLFVGFSMRDPFFNMTMDLVRKDFTLTNEPAYFSIIPFDVDLSATAGLVDPTIAHEEEKERIRSTLPRGLVPIFYHAPTDPATGRQDHSQLRALIDDLGARARTAPRTESVVDRLARRALEEL